MKLDKFLCSMSWFSFWPWPCTKHNSCLQLTEKLTNINVLTMLLVHSVWAQNKRLRRVKRPSNLASLLAPLMFVGLQNHSRLLTMAISAVTKIFPFKILTVKFQVVDQDKATKSKINSFFQKNLIKDHVKFRDKYIIIKYFLPCLQEEECIIPTSWVGLSQILFFLEFPNSARQ